MNTRILTATTLCAVCSCMAATTIDPANKYVYGANVGWVNAEADTVNGAEIGQAFCVGYLYGANIGWIHLGNGAPANGMAYQNSSASDYGINHDGLGQLSGYAFGANIGWITFEQTQGKPQVDLTTGALSGYAWGANVGWIDLSTLVTLSLAAPDSDSDGIPDAWEYGHTNTLLVLPAGDSDGDGISDAGEYAADTDPFDPDDVLMITDFAVAESTNSLTWTAKPTRLYTLQHVSALSNGMSWVLSRPPFVPTSGPTVTEDVVGVSDTNRFYRVEARPPLTP